MSKTDPHDDLSAIERSTGLALDDPREATVLAALRSAGIFDDDACAPTA